MPYTHALRARRWLLLPPPGFDTPALVQAQLIERVLVLGSGARENALARALARGATGRRVLIAPGNGGGAGFAQTAPIDLADHAAIIELARRERAQLVVVGPEAPLTAGVVDALTEAGLVAFGPSRAAARLEGSKAFLKDIAARAGIPTARHRVARSLAEAEHAIAEFGAPVVVKADGLCAGKGVVVASSVEQALGAARSMIEERVFGAAGECVVIEECLLGRELSVHAISDGERFVVLPPARDHKRIHDADRGPNTGGMGVICPPPDVSPELSAEIAERMIAPTLRAMREAGTPFRGVLFAGIMLTERGPMLLEHNVRFGDPECEALMELCEGDLAQVLYGAATGQLDPEALVVRRDLCAVVVVMSAAGYPQKPCTGDEIFGIEQAEAVGAVVHHAGTERRDGRVLTSGGRVLAVTAAASRWQDARAKAYAACRLIRFEGQHYRRDIGGPTEEPA